MQVAASLAWFCSLRPMSDADVIQLERRDDGVAVITLNNPKVNSLSTYVLRRLHTTVSELQDDLPGAVVVTGGDRIFAAGADISEFNGPDEAYEIGLAFHESFDALAALPRVTIAAITGYALGGGCELALACDLRIAADNVRIGQPEVLLGIVPGGGGSQRLPRLVGASRAKELIMSGRQVKADEALRIGLVDEVVPADQLPGRALERAAEFARGALAAQALAKRAIDEGLGMSLPAALELEQRLFVEVFHTQDSRIGVDSFREHGPGKATFTGG
jgi:enoyl-CoA hydratase/carnithine racemase